MTKLIALTHALGSKINSNQELEERYNLSRGFIQDKTGIKERRYFSKSEDPIHIGASLVKKLLAQLGIKESPVVFGSSNPYGSYQIPAPTMQIAHKAGLRNCAIFNINYGCGGYLGALQVLHEYLGSHPDTFALLVLSDWPSSMVNKYETAVLFSDAVHVSVWTNISGYPGPEVDRVFFENTLENPFALNVKDGFWDMDGRLISKFVRKVPSLIAEKMNIKLADYEIIPHQPNAKLLETLEKDYGVPFYKKDVENFGNTTCAAMMIALENFLKNSQFTKPLLLMGFGDTESYGAVALNFKGEYPVWPHSSSN